VFEHRSGCLSRFNLLHKCATSRYEERRYLLPRHLVVIAKHHQEVPLHLLSKVLIAQAREEKRRRTQGEMRRRPRPKGDGA